VWLPDDLAVEFDGDACGIKVELTEQIYKS
jgi:hypothetical protein